MVNKAVFMTIHVLGSLCGIGGVDDGRERYGDSWCIVLMVITMIVVVIVVITVTVKECETSANISNISVTTSISGWWWY